MMNETNLNEYYQINVNHLLSTRLDADISKGFFEKVVFHGTAYNSLLTIVDSFLISGQSTFTLTGSYGTGKSTLGAILTGLVHSDKVIRESARQLIGEKKLLKKIDKVFYISEEKPWLIIKAIAGLSTPVELFHKSILQALIDSKLIEIFEDDFFFLNEEIKNEHQLVEWLGDIFTMLDGHISGAIFILDEMGKLLDNIARNTNDLHIFQELAEKITRLSRKDCPFIFIGILHQAFADYAKGLSHQIAIEWSKIQGRYIDISYRISLDESIALVSKTIKRTDKKLPEQIESINEILIAKVQNSINSRLIENSPNIQKYFKDAMPLHPLTTVLLGAIAKSSFSQNERSIFSFLLSIEPYSFRKFLDNNKQYNETYTIMDLWDYLSQNLQHQILSSKEGHLWSVVEQALTLLSQKLNQTDNNLYNNIYFKIIKSIAMMNLFGKSLGVYATEDLLGFSMPNDLSKIGSITLYLEKLVEWGIITYWNRTNSYEVVETSEINIQQILNEKISNLNNTQNYLNYINYNGNLILAKRYYQQKGIMRWMGQYLINNLSDLNIIVNEKKIKDNNAFSNFILISESSLKEEKIVELSFHYNNIVLGKLKNLNEISSWAKEIYALNLIIKEQPKISIDPVAKKEFEQRLHSAYQQLDILFEQAFNESKWFYNGGVINSNSLSIIASDIADRIFNKSPSIFNELVVRNEISTSAAAGRRKLLEAMLKNSNKENLGIEKFPSEKSIYLSCLKELTLHQYDQKLDIWKFVIPQNFSLGQESNHLLVSNLLNDGYELIKNNKGLTLISSLYEYWNHAPYGIPKGVLPIFVLALLLAKKDALAFYDKDITQEYRFISEIDEEFLNKLIKRPNEVAVKYIKAKAEKEKFVEIFTNCINEIYGKNISSTPLQLARFIVSYINKQSSWTKFSRDKNYFDTITQNLRSVILKAEDPFKLLFDEIYEILDIENSTEIQIKSKLSDFFITIDSSKSNLINNFKKKLENELGNIDENLLHDAERISKTAADWQMQKFAFHLVNSSIDSQQWLINLITLLSQKPERDWTDDSIKRALELLPSYIQRFKLLCFFAKNNHSEDTYLNEKRHLSVIINTPKGFEEYNRDVRVTDDIKERVNSLAVTFKEYLNKVEANKDTKTIVLYELLREYLNPVYSEDDDKYVC
ncbi:hypothetical protein R4514_14430 [Acinetobacter baumannii]|nr:hypothetical protein [Acinetobacter baumannii]